MYKDIKQFVAQQPLELWGTHLNKQQEWHYLEFGDKRESWKRFRRAIYCRPAYEDRQRLLEFARPDTLIYTNLGVGGKIDTMLRKAGAEDLLDAATLIGCYHGRDRDELVHRALKDFIDEQLPFKRFQQNHAFYYTALIAFALFEALKVDVADPVVAVTAYPTTLRRMLIDVAGKIVSHGGQIVLKVTGAVLRRLRFDELWRRCSSPPPIPRLAQPAVVITQKTRIATVQRDRCVIDDAIGEGVQGIPRVSASFVITHRPAVASEGHSTEGTGISAGKSEASHGIAQFR